MGSDKLQYIYKTVMLVWAVLLFSSCYSNKELGLLQGNDANLPHYEPTEYLEYRLRVDDEVVFRLLSAETTISKMVQGDQYSLTGNQVTYRVYSDGTLDLPYMKSIRVAGLTMAEATQVVEERFRELLPDASVRLALANKQFTILGEIGSGVFPMYNDKLTIFEALSMSGKFKPSADLKKVRILRPSDQGIRILEFDIRTRSVLHSAYYYIYPNDIIYIQKSSSGFWKTDSYSSFVGLITSSLTLMLAVLNLSTPLL